MKEIFLFWFLLMSKSRISCTFDPTKFDYCSIKCKENIHSACKCEEQKAKNEIIMDEMENFRVQMTELHNDFRDQIARGDEPDCPKAANMMELSYNLELEYISKCYAKVMAQNHDKCRKLHNHEYNPGQNLHGSSEKANPKEYNDTYKQALASWYNEVKNFTEDKKKLLEKFYDTGGVVIGHFTQLVWATMTRVGCTRVWIPTNSIMRNMLVCNYAGNDGAGGNIIGKPVFVFGDPCSKCPQGSKCDKNSKHNALCRSNISNESHFHMSTTSLESDDLKVGETSSVAMNSYSTTTPIKNIAENLISKTCCLQQNKMLLSVVSFVMATLN